MKIENALDRGTQEQFGSIRIVVHQRANQMFRALVAIQWVVAIGVSISITKILGLGISTDVPLVPLLAFSTLTLAGMLTLSQLAVYRTYQLTVNQTLLRLCSRQSELLQTNRDADELIKQRTQEFKAANRQLRQEVERRVKAEGECENLTRKLLQAARQASILENANRDSRRPDVAYDAGLAGTQTHGNEHRLRPTRRMRSEENAS